MKRIILLTCLALAGCDSNTEIPTMLDCAGHVISINGTKASYGNLHATLVQREHTDDNMIDIYIFEYEKNTSTYEYIEMMLTRANGGYRTLWKNNWSMIMSRVANNQGAETLVNDDCKVMK